MQPPFLRSIASRSADPVSTREASRDSPGSCPTSIIQSWPDHGRSACSVSPGRAGAGEWASRRRAGGGGGGERAAGGPGGERGGGGGGPGRGELGRGGGLRDGIVGRAGGVVRGRGQPGHRGGGAPAETAQRL